VTSGCSRASQGPAWVCFHLFYMGLTNYKILIAC
jgi:hypothetical protein